MRKFSLTAALLLCAAAAAHAQTTPAGTPLPPHTSPVEPQIIRDPVKRDEAHIAATRRSNKRPDPWYDKPDTFKAEIKVTNHSAQAIRSVSWTATLLDSETGQVIRAFDVTTETRIAPGSTRKLSERLLTPRDRVVRANSRRPDRPNVADLKVKVNTVTYADGTTSTTP